MVRIGTYYSMYEKGARIVSVSSYYPVNNGFKKSFGNYDLTFSRNGMLIHSFHIEEHKNYEIDYHYDPKGKFLKAEQWNFITKELEEVTEYTYDRKGRIQTERCRSYYPRLMQKISDMNIIHTYKTGSEITVRTSDDDDQYTTYYSYSNTGRLIEEKSFYKREGLHEWIINEYDENDNQIRRILLDNKGELYLAYEFFPDQNGQNTGYKCISMDTNYLREFDYKFNDRGHWISQIQIDDGVERNICERTIVYY